MLGVVQPEKIKWISFALTTRPDKHAVHPSSPESQIKLNYTHYIFALTK